MTAGEEKVNVGTLTLLSVFRSTNVSYVFMPTLQLELMRKVCGASVQRQPGDPVRDKIQPRGFTINLTFVFMRQDCKAD